MKTNPPVIILPRGIKTVGDIFESRAFKDFIQEKARKYFFEEKPKLQTNKTFASGTGRSRLNEYLKTLPTIPFSKLSTSNEVLGRTVMILDIHK